MQQLYSSIPVLIMQQVDAALADHEGRAKSGGGRVGIGREVGNRLAVEREANELGEGQAACRVEEFHAVPRPESDCAAKRLRLE